MAELISTPPLQKPPGYKDPHYAAKPLTPQPPRNTFVLPPSFQQKKRRSCRCRPFCCFICFLILILFIVVFIAGGLFYLWFNPKLPVFYLHSFQISQFNVAGKSDDTYLDAQTKIRIEVRNPNAKLPVTYGEAEVIATLEDGTALGSEILPSFTQGKKNAKSLIADTTIRNHLVGRAKGTKLKDLLREKELVVKVEVRTSFELVAEGSRIGPVPIKALCGGVSLKTLDGPIMPKCNITWFDWINIQ